MNRRLFLISGLGMLALLLYILMFQYPKLNLIAGYTAKDMASQVFLVGRNPDEVRRMDHNFPLLKLAKTVVDTVKKTATATVFGLCERKAFFQEGIGATLLAPKQIPTTKKTLSRHQPFINQPYPYGNNPAKDTIFPEWDYKHIDAVVSNAFKETNSNKKNTRGLLVLYKDHILAEKYGTGFEANTPMVGWSMTKSLAATLIGILKHQGKLDLTQPLSRLNPFKHWSKDNRKTITTENLLVMNSGLAWEENYETISDVTKILYLDQDITKRALNSKLTNPVGKNFCYSTGTSTLLSKVMESCVPSESFSNFPYTNLLDRIGMYSAVIESDIIGNFAFGSYAWATMRDWAKLGLLYLHQGLWQSERIFDNDWSSYVATPKANNIYGAHFWTNQNGKLYPNLPKDTYSMNGHYGQRVIIIPSKDLVLVRMGLTASREDDPDLNLMTNHLVADFLESLKKY